MLRKDVACRVAVALLSLFIRRSWQSEAFCIVSELIKTQLQQQEEQEQQESELELELAKLYFLVELNACG